MRSFIRTLLKIFLFLDSTVVLILIAAFCWLYFYSRDLPDIGSLAQYAPANVTQVKDPCLGPSTAVPYEAIGTNVRNAISAVEVKEDDAGVLKAELFNRGALHRKTLAVAVSGTICYSPQRTLER